MIKSIKKSLGGVALCALALTSLSSTKALRANDDFNANLLIFTAELEEFVDLALAQIEKGGSLSEQEKTVQELMLTANRIALVYYDEATDEIRASLDQHLGKVITSNPTLDPYFTLIGNSFMKIAERLVTSREESDRKVRIWSTVVGTVAGVALGGYILHVRLPNGLGSLGAKDALYAASAVFGLGALGLGAGYAISYALPVDRRLENARDFVKRYPFGQDFLNHLKKDSDDLNLDALLNDEGTGDRDS